MYSASEIGSLIKKFCCSALNNSYKRMAEAEDGKTLEARRGYVAMYVGEEAKRYQVPIKYLSSPAFQEMLIRSQHDELETKIDGPIRIACTPERFERMLKVAKHETSFEVLTLQPDESLVKLKSNHTCKPTRRRWPGKD